MTLIRADHKIKYYATPLVRSSVCKKLSALLSVSEDNFSAYFDVQDLSVDVWNNIDGLDVKPIFSPHPVETSIFIFRTFGEEGYRSYGHFADIVSLNVLKKMIAENTAQTGISQGLYDRVKNSYLTTVDLKKLDIGGGMIHGTAEDFSNDESEKIILAHTSQPLTGRQKEIGSGAPFGTLDRLIPSYRDYGWQAAYKFLKTNFPLTPDHQLQILLNSEIVDLNPHTILLKEGENHQEIYLTLTGVVEGIKSSQNKGLFYAGTLIGEESGMDNLPCEQTFRSLSFVRALKIPAGLYVEFANQNKLHEAIEQLQTIREFLKETWLFGEGISCPVLNKIAQATQQIQISNREKWSYTRPNALYLVAQGCLERIYEGITFEVMTAGNFFGEEKAIFNKPHLLKIHIKEPSKMYRIPGSLLEAIPIVRWKLFESWEKRKSLVLVENKFSIPASLALENKNNLFSRVKNLLRR